MHTPQIGTVAGRTRSVSRLQSEARRDHVVLEVAWRFPAPVRPGDVITARARVLEARDDKPVTHLATSVTNQDGVTVLDGTAVVWRDPAVASAAGGPPHSTH